MGRRSDHSPEELRQLLLDKGGAHMAAHGLARFSARAVAKSAGYSVGTIYNVFGSLDVFILAINTLTFAQWTEQLREALDGCGPRDDRIAALIHAYFRFALTNTNLWSAIFDHRRPPNMPMDPAGVEQRAGLTAIVDAEVCRYLGRPVDQSTIRLTRSLIATVHGHCVLSLGGSLTLMGEQAPVESAISRVAESLFAHRERPHPTFYGSTSPGDVGESE